MVGSGQRSRILVLGGTGFIGRGLIETLGADGGYAVAWTTRDPASPSAPSQRLGRPIVIDDLDSLDLELPGEHDIVIDLASRGRGRLASTRDIIPRIHGHCRIIETLANQRWAGHYIFMSSGGTIYGLDPPGLCHEDLPLAPTSDYALEKAIIELQLQSVVAQSPMEVSVLRVANAIGETQPATLGFGVVPAIVAALRGEGPFRLYGDGKTQRDYVYVDDVLQAVLLAMRSGGVGTVNIGSGVGTSLGELLALCSRLAGRSIEVEPVTIEGPEPKSIVLDITRARDRLGWRPQVDLETALRRILAHHGLLAPR